MTERDAWIHMVTEDEAAGDLKAQYDQLRDPQTGGVDNILRIHGQRPATLHAHHTLYHTMMYGPSSIRRPEREMIGVVVSALNRCRY